MAELGIPFIAAGRSLSRLEEQMAKVPELEGHDYECVEVSNDRAALAELFAGKKVVYNVVGPFMQLAGPVVEACLDAGCHYLDTTGEQDWMFHVKRTWGEQFAEKGLVAIPALSYMWVAGQLAAEIALEDPAIDSLDLMYLADSAGYLGVCMLMFGKGAVHTGDDFLGFFLPLCGTILTVAIILFSLSLILYRNRFPRHLVPKTPSKSS